MWVSGPLRSHGKRGSTSHVVSQVLSALRGLWATSSISVFGLCSLFRRGAQALLNLVPQRQRGRGWLWSKITAGRCCQHHLSTCGPHCSQLWSWPPRSQPTFPHSLPSLPLLILRPPAPGLFSLCGERRNFYSYLTEQLSPRESTVGWGTSVAQFI